jgi:serine/threonine protein kinase
MVGGSGFAGSTGEEREASMPDMDPTMIGSSGSVGPGGAAEGTSNPATEAMKERVPEIVISPFGEPLMSSQGDTLQRSVGSMPAPPRPLVELPAGYNLLGFLGQGGMGVVYKARHVRLDRIVALKMLRSGDQAGATERARFHTEAQAAARLQHPNIVQIYEVGEANGQPYFCMEYIEGDSLTRLIDGTPWPAVRAAQLVETLARAIDAAHQAGIVHRDLKPGNVLLSFSRDAERSAGAAALRSEDSASRLNEATPKISDFGLAKMLGSNHSQTKTESFLGTPCYAAPEQAGAHNSAIGPHTDIYALGAILYELLTGRPPFRGTTVLETIRQVIEQEPAGPRLLNPSVSPDLEAICLKCLEKNPAARYASAADLAEDLRRWQQHEPIRARPPGPLGRAIRWCRRHPALTSIAAVIVLGVVGMSWQWREAVAAGKLAEERREAAEKAGVLADRARQNAEEEAAAAREVANFLGGLFEEADPFVLTNRVFGEQPNMNPSALDIVNRGAKRLANPDFIKEKPLVRATLLDRVGHVYLSLGDGERAERFVNEALELRRKHLPADHADLASSLHNVGFLQLTRGNLKKSRDLFASAFDMRSRLFGSHSREAMTSRFHLAAVGALLGDSTAEQHLLEVLAFQRAQLAAAEKHNPEAVGSAALECSFTLLTICLLYGRGNRGLEAAPYALEAERVSRKIANKELAGLMGSIVNFRRWRAFGMVDRAEKELLQALRTIEKRSGKHHYLYVTLQWELASLYFDSNRYLEAEKTYLDLEGPYRKTIGASGLQLAHLYYSTARSIARGSLARAEQARDNAQYRKQVARVEHYARAAYLQGKRDAVPEYEKGVHAVFLAWTLLYLRPEPDNAGAEEVAREAVRIRNAVHGVGHELSSHPLSFLLLALARQNKVEEIEKVFLDLLARNPRPKWDQNAADALPTAARKLAGAGKIRTAVLVLEQAIRAGYYRLDLVGSDPSFASLRESEEYQQLHWRLSK